MFVPGFAFSPLACRALHASELSKTRMHLSTLAVLGQELLFWLGTCPRAFL